MNVLDLQRVALWWGPGVVVLILFGYGFLRLAHYWIEKTMEVKRQQTEGAYNLVQHYVEQFLGAQSGQADALCRLANSVEHRESQDSFEHQEILIGLKALHRDMGGLQCRNGAECGSLRTPAGFSAWSSSVSEGWRESRTPGCEAGRAMPEETLPAGAGREAGKQHFTSRSVGGETGPAAHQVLRPIANSGNRS
jgi:hypothetical protein